MRNVRVNVFYLRASVYARSRARALLVQQYICLLESLSEKLHFDRLKLIRERTLYASDLNLIRMWLEILQNLRVSQIGQFRFGHWPHVLQSSARVTDIISQKIK